ncbi:MAG: hypothetical protein ACE14M_16815 [Terriglobales bacterium]
MEQDVIAPNLAAHKELVSAVARRLAPREILIDPTVLPVFPDWSQSDYHAIWTTVIQRWVKRVVFAQDWQYSIGCTQEFLTARQSGLAVLDADERRIEIAKAIELISSAVTETRSVNGNASVLEGALQGLLSVQE